MIKNFFLTAMVLLLVVGLNNLSFAGTSTKAFDVTATIPQMNGQLSVTITGITPNGCTGTNDVWDTTSSTSVAFGTLSYDTTLDPTTNQAYNVFRAAKYYAVDVGVQDNVSTTWTLTHTRTSLAKDASNNLDSNVNVTFQKVSTSNPAGTDLDKVSYGNSNSKAYTKAQLNGGWLRIYYGIGSGIGPATANPNNCVRDATGVSPITVSNAAGTYTGRVTLTLVTQ